MPFGSFFEQARFLDNRPCSQLMAESPEMRVVAFYLKPGQAVSPHRSPCRVMMTVLKGRGHLLTGDGARPVVPGDWAVCEPNEPHGFSAQESMVVLAVIAPSPAAIGSRPSS